MPSWVAWSLLFVIKQRHFKMFHSRPNYTKSRVHQSQACFLKTTHLDILKKIVYSTNTMRGEKIENWGTPFQRNLSFGGNFALQKKKYGTFKNFGNLVFYVGNSPNFPGLTNTLVNYIHLVTARLELSYWLLWHQYFAIQFINCKM